MSNTYNSWSHVEENMLLSYMLAGLQNGIKVTKLISDFANTYNLTETSVKSKWQLVRKENEMIVNEAKRTWLRWGKVELEEKRKQDLLEAKRIAKLQKKSQSLRIEWKKEKAKRTKNGDQVRINTGMVAKEQDKRRYIQIDDHGVVTAYRDITAS